MLTAEQIELILKRNTVVASGSLIVLYELAAREIEAESRAQALEDAAKVCDAKSNRLLNSSRIVSPVVAMAECAASIRALSEQAGKGE